MTAGPAGAVLKVKPLICPNCGGTVQLRGFGQTVNAICGNCQTVLDASTPSLAVLQKFGARPRVEPLIPLGSRGNWRGATFELIGFQVREIEVEGQKYHWSEYLLYNPYQGYRYLTEYDGHWNYGNTLRALPEGGSGDRGSVRFRDGFYKLFQRSVARTVFVLGEFPWQVRVGDPVTVSDYVRPPLMISSESAGGEVVWSIGEYITGQSVWQAFALQGKPPVARGIFANQPSPYQGKIGSVWKTFAWLLGALFLLMAGMAMVNRNEAVFNQHYFFDSHHSGEASFVTPVFELKGHTSGVEVKVSTDLNNDWAYFNFALINEGTGTAYDFSRQVSYYYGSDSDGSWSEGGKTGSTTIPAVPPGRYYLRVEPEMDSQASGSIFSTHAVSYDIAVKRGVPTQLFFVIAFFLLFIPPIVTTIRASKFEGRRWAESDIAPVSSSSSGDNN